MDSRSWCGHAPARRLPSNSRCSSALRSNALNLDDLENSPRSTIALALSQDAGSSFEVRPVEANYVSGVWFEEPALVRMRSGKLIMQVRTRLVTAPDIPAVWPRRSRWTSPALV